MSNDFDPPCGVHASSDALAESGLTKHVCSCVGAEVDPGAAIEVLDHVSAALPLHSGLTEMLMQAPARMSDPHAVRTTYASYAAAMDELGIDVERSVRDLHQKVISQTRDT